MPNKTIYLTGSTTIPPRKSTFYRIFGALLVLYSGFQIHSYFIKQPYYELTIELINNFHFWNILLLFGLGVNVLFIGFQLTGRKSNQYIRFSKEKIVYKPSYLKDPKSIDVNDLKEIVISPTWILCVSNKEKFMIDLSWVSPHVTSRIIFMVEKLSNIKQIKLKGQNK